MPSYFLAKTDPETYSIDKFEKEHETEWDGVHSPQALQAIKAWKKGDRVLIYHSQGQAKIMGLAEVIGQPHVNEKDPRPSWSAKVRFLKKFPEEQQISLKEIKTIGLFNDFALVKQGRLSTMECPTEFIDWLKARGVKC